MNRSANQGKRWFGWPGIVATFAFLFTFAGIRAPGWSAVPVQAPAPAPILVITSEAASFAAYYPEILRAEGLNAFDVADISTVTEQTLAHHDLVLLAKTPLSDAQADMLRQWVEGGGNLIAMVPDARLAGLFGLRPTGETLDDAYLSVDPATAAGRGIVNQSIQFHGRAERYLLDGATSLATLYATAEQATANPAVTLRRVGAHGGQAAAFAYSLASSIVYTRQGNPAWAAEERDGIKPIRADDLFFGNAAGDPQPDWVDPAKIAIPQADEQQRLLANLIVLMNLPRKPLPRFWYFPHGKRAVIIMTGDDHAHGGTAGRFEQFIAQSPAGCSLENWECIRGTSYIFPYSPLSNAQAARFEKLGFEIALHIDTDCKDYTPASLDAAYAQQTSAWNRKYWRLPAPRTQRHHCIVWSDWATAPKVQASHGMRFDLSYYFWPPRWSADVPGLFTGSAMPMRFADLDGQIIDVYGTATQMTDESGQSYPYTVDTLLDRALGPEEYFGAYTVNAHTDAAHSEVADAVVKAALKRGVPIVSGRQMLTWLDGRNESSFQALAWNGKTLGFTVTAASGSTGLQAMLPLHSATARLNDIERDGHAVDFTVARIKGIDYAIFAAPSGDYLARYGNRMAEKRRENTPRAAGASATAFGPSSAVARAPR